MLEQMGGVQYRIFALSATRVGKAASAHMDAEEDELDRGFDYLIAHQHEAQDKDNLKRER